MNLSFPFKNADRIKLQITANTHSTEFDVGAVQWVIANDITTKNVFLTLASELGSMNDEQV